MSSELYWAGGFWDGEGSASWCKGKPTAGIHQNDPEVLERFCLAVEMGKVYGPYKHKPGSKRPAFNQFWDWRVGGKYQVEKLAILLEPYIGTVKRLQFKEALNEFLG